MDAITLKQIAKEVISEMGDQGTCCIGMRLRQNGRTITEGIVQGNMTNYAYFDRVKAHLIENEGAKESDFSIEHGYMD